MRLPRFPFPAPLFWFDSLFYPSPWDVPFYLPVNLFICCSRCPDPHCARPTVYFVRCFSHYSITLPTGAWAPVGRHTPPYLVYDVGFSQVPANLVTGQQQRPITCFVQENKTGLGAPLLPDILLCQDKHRWTSWTPPLLCHSSVLLPHLPCC